MQDRLEVTDLEVKLIVLKSEFTGDTVDLDELPDHKNAERENEAYNFRTEDEPDEGILISIYEESALVRGSIDTDELQEAVDKMRELVNGTSFEGTIQEPEVVNTVMLGDFSGPEEFLEPDERPEFANKLNDRLSGSDIEVIEFEDGEGDMLWLLHAKLGGGNGSVKFYPNSVMITGVEADSIEDTFEKEDTVTGFLNNALN